MNPGMNSVDNDCVILVETNYSNVDMCKFEPSQSNGQHD